MLATCFDGDSVSGVRDSSWTSASAVSRQNSQSGIAPWLEYLQRRGCGGEIERSEYQLRAALKYFGFKDQIVESAIVDLRSSGDVTLRL
jgi:hypothetical protein